MAIKQSKLLKILETHFNNAKITVKDTVGDNNHYQITIVSDIFTDLVRIKRHQLVYSVLNDLLVNGQLHAISMQTLTVKEQSIQNESL